MLLLSNIAKYILSTVIIKMYKLIKTLIIVGLVLSTSFYRGGTAKAAAGPFTCSSNFYQVISGQLKLLDPLTGQYSNIGSTAGFDYNAIGYNTQDNYIYGIQEDGANYGDLLKIANDGSVTDLGLPTGLPRASNDFAGDFDLSGNLYILTNTQALYKVNVASLTATLIPTTGDAIVGASDLVFVNGSLYLLQGDILSVVNLTTDNVTTGTVSGPSGWLSAGNSFGAGWTDSSGELFFSNNLSGSIYQITNYNSSTPTATFKVTGTVTSVNDGASCALAAQSPFDPPAATNDSYSTTYNKALNEVNGSLLNNDAGNGLTVTSYSQPSHGTVTVNPDGTFIYTPTDGFIGTDIFTYTATDSVGRTTSATVTINILASTTVLSPNTGHGLPSQVGSLIPGIFSASLILIFSGLSLYFRRLYQ